MKYALFSLMIVSVFLINCTNHTDQFVTLKGHILNAPTDSIYVYDNFDEYKKAIILDEHNNFYDTLNIGTAEYYFEIGEESTNLFLSPGDDLEITIDYLSFDESINATGKGQKINNYLFKRVLSRESEIYNNDAFFDKDSAQFYHDLNIFFDKEIHTLDGLLLDSNIFIEEKEGIAMTKKNIGYYYLSKQEIKKLANLEYAPDFTFEDINGDSFSLSDFKGKLVFIDVLATWCKPCLKEIPDLKKLQKNLEGSDIHFVGISIDLQEDNYLWKKKVNEEQLAGIQLIMDKAWQSQFKFDYAISAIPRFILFSKRANSSMLMHQDHLKEMN